MAASGEAQLLVKFVTKLSPEYRVQETPMVGKNVLFNVLNSWNSDAVPTFSCCIYCCAALTHCCAALSVLGAIFFLS